MTKSKTNKPAPRNGASKRSSVRVQRLGREWIMSGDGSVTLWNDINGAKTVAQLRHALYHLAARCQLLESEIKALSTKQISEQ